ncbi:MAG: glycosyltransferase [Opitutales bacterium]
MLSDTSTCFLALGIEPETGGTYKSLKLFQDALGGPILAFSTKRKTGERSPDGSIEYLGSRNLHYLGGAFRKRVRERAQATKLLSCHVIFRYHTEITRQVARDLSRPYWAIPHGSMDPWVFRQAPRIKETWFRFFGKGFFAGAAHVICATERERDKVRERHDGPNLRVVHWPVRVPDLSEREQARSDLHAELGLPHGARILLFFGRYHTMKRPLETIALFLKAGLSERTHLVMAGIDYDVPRAQLEAEARANPRIHVLPATFGEKRSRLLLGCDAFISLSHRENFNHSAAEAMAAGQALFLSPGNDLRYSFPQGSDFGWFPDTDSDVEYIEHLRAFDRMGDEDLWAKGAAASQWASQELSFEKFRESLRTLHREAVGKPANHEQKL